MRSATTLALVFVMKTFLISPAFHKLNSSTMDKAYHIRATTLQER